MTLEEYINKEKIEWIDLKYADIHGGLHHITFPREKLKTFLKNGVGIDGSSVPGFAAKEYSDMRIFPDTSKFYRDPFSEIPTVILFGDVYCAEGDKPFTDGPRTVLVNALKLLQKLGIGDELLILPELEFYIFKDVYYDLNVLVSCVEIDHVDSVPPDNGYHIDAPYDGYRAFRDRVTMYLHNLGIPIKYTHRECGRYSQHEIEIDYKPSLINVENILLSKYIIFRSAEEEGLKVTFMPKPIHNEPGSGLHLHMMLMKNGTSLFYDKEKGSFISQTARYFIGGILHHLPALISFTNASTNSYKRLFSGFEAPKKIAYSIANRSVAIRIPGYEKGKNVDIEYRPSDAMFNPYLAVAAILLAGIDGIVSKTNPGKPISGDIDNDSNVKDVPRGLLDSLEALDNDRVFLKRGDVFSDFLLDKWIYLKKKEYWEVELRPSVAEYIRYFGR